MNYQRNRVPHLAVLSLMLIGIASLLTFSGWPHSVQAIKLLRNNAFARGAETVLAHPALDQPVRLVNGASNTTALPIANGLSNAHAFFAMQQGCKCADVVLVVDSTLSMAPAIANVDAGMVSIINTAISATGGNLRLGVVTFKDTINVDQPLTTNTAAVQATVSAITASGGALEPEASDEALKYVVTGSSACSVAQPKGPLGTFRSECFKIVVIVTDARPGGCDDAYVDGVDDNNAMAVANTAKTNSVIISSILVDNGSVSSGLYPGGVEDFVMNFYAATTGGQFIKIPSNGTGASAGIEKIIKDATPPTIVCPADITRSTDPGKCDAVITYQIPVGDNCPGVTVVCTPPSGSAFPKGTTTVNCTATDTSGNMASCSFKVTVVDNERPVLACPANVTRPTDPGLCSAVVNYTVTAADNCPGVAVNCNPPSGSVFQKGTTAVNCTAVDAAGNMSMCSFPVIVVDNEKPQITCPKDITTTSCGGPVVISYPPPTVSDNCPGVTVACVPPSSTAFPLGVTTVTCTATDSSGNQNSCGFKVNIEAAKCDAICFRSPQYYLLNLDSLPRGPILIGGVNSNVPVTAIDSDAIRLALQGNALGFGTLTPLQELNIEFVAAQLSLNAAGGDGSPVAFNALWSPIHVYGLNLAPIALSNGFTFTRDSMLKDLFMQARSAITENRTVDMIPLARLFELLNGNDPLGACGPRHPIADLVPTIPFGFNSLCAFFTSSGMSFLRITIKNQGDASAPASITTVTFGSTAVPVVTPALLPNETVDLDVLVPAGSGPPVTLKISADASGALPERSKLNNVVTASCP